MRRGRIGKEGLSKARVFSAGTVKERKEGGLQYESMFWGTVRKSGQGITPV